MKEREMKVSKKTDYKLLASSVFYALNAEECVVKIYSIGNVSAGIMLKALALLNTIIKEDNKGYDFQPSFVTKKDSEGNLRNFIVCTVRNKKCIVI